MTNSIIRKLTVAFILLLNINNSLAETSDTQKPLKEYDVEIIIFEDAHARYLNSESWNTNTSDEEYLTDGNTLTKNISKQKKPKSKTETNYKNIEPAILGKEYKRINNSSEFNVIQYSAWRQTGLKDTDAFEININQLDNSHKSRSKNTISGTVKVVLARYLHFYGELEYVRLNKPDEKNGDLADNEAEATAEGLSVDENQNIELTPVNSFTLQSHRRMRSKELHYIDHPMVGILIQINPVEPAPSDQAN